MNFFLAITGANNIYLVVEHNFELRLKSYEREIDPDIKHYDSEYDKQELKDFIAEEKARKAEDEFDLNSLTEIECDEEDDELDLDSLTYVECDEEEDELDLENLSDQILENDESDEREKRKKEWEKYETFGAPIYVQSNYEVVEAFTDSLEADKFISDCNKQRLKGLPLWKYRHFSRSEFEYINQTLRTYFDEDNYKVVIPYDISNEQIEKLEHLVRFIFYRQQWCKLS